MKLLTYLAILFLIPSCAAKAPIDQEAIAVKVVNPHPMFSDHGKQLVVRGRNGTVLDTRPLYADNGSGCNAYLFDTEETFTLVDCNGQWYEVAKKTGKVIGESWNWEKQLPPKYLGTFFWAGDSVYYAFKTGERPASALVYQWKDPGTRE